ncbi:MAG: hypothetical protein ACM3RR_00050 [Bacillota bacterium]
MWLTRDKTQSKQDLKPIKIGIASAVVAVLLVVSFSAVIYGYKFVVGDDISELTSGEDCGYLFLAALYAFAAGIIMAFLYKRWKW